MSQIPALPENTLATPMHFRRGAAKALEGPHFRRGAAKALEVPHLRSGAAKALEGPHLRSGAAKALEGPKYGRCYVGLHSQSAGFIEILARGNKLGGGIS